MFLPNQFDGVIMDSSAKESKAQPVAGALRFLEAWDTARARLLKL